MKEIYRALGDYFSRKADTKDGNKRNRRSINDTVAVDEYMPQTPEARASYSIRIYPANGGNVVEVRAFRPEKSNQIYEDNTQLYIVQDGEDLVEGIGKAMMLTKMSS